MAAVSRIISPVGAESLTDFLGHYFTYLELYPGMKLDHFKQLKKDSSVEYKDMFFHNDQGNIDEVSNDEVFKLGITCIHVNARIRMNIELLKSGLDKFQGSSGW